LENILHRHGSLATNRPKVLDRLRFPKKDILDIQGKLIMHTTSISAFLQSIGLGACGRFEHKLEKLDNIHDILPRLIASVDRLGAEARTSGNVSSALSDHTNDEKRVWEDFRSRLIAEG
jgi:hypothetical protein